MHQAVLFFKCTCMYWEQWRAGEWLKCSRSKGRLSHERGTAYHSALWMKMPYTQVQCSTYVSSVRLTSPSSSLPFLMSCRKDIIELTSRSTVYTQHNPQYIHSTSILYTQHSTECTMDCSTEWSTDLVYTCTYWDSLFTSTKGKGRGGRPRLTFANQVSLKSRGIR